MCLWCGTYRRNAIKRDKSIAFEGAIPIVNGHQIIETLDLFSNKIEKVALS